MAHHRFYQPVYGMRWPLSPITLSPQTHSVSWHCGLLSCYHFECSQRCMQTVFSSSWTKVSHSFPGRYMVMYCIRRTCSVAIYTGSENRPLRACVCKSNGQQAHGRRTAHYLVWRRVVSSPADWPLAAAAAGNIFSLSRRILTQSSPRLAAVLSRRVRASCWCNAESFYLFLSFITLFACMCVSLTVKRLTSFSSNLLGYLDLC